MPISNVDTSALGNYQIVPNVGARPTGTARYPGKLVYQADAQIFVWWDGSVWQPLGTGGGGGGGGVTAFAALTDVNVPTISDGDLVIWDATNGYLKDIAPETIPIISTLVTSTAQNTAAIAAVNTQASVVGTRGLGTFTSNSTAVVGDLYAESTTVNVATNDKITSMYSQLVGNSLPVTDKTTVVITTTSGSSTVTATSGTFAATDTDRQIVATGIPASTYLVFVSSTSATLKSSTGAAVTATASGTGVTTVISSPPLVVSYLSKWHGLNGAQTDVAFAPTGDTKKYLVTWWSELTIGSDSLHHTQESHLRVLKPHAVGSTTAPGAGVYTEPSNSPSNPNREADLWWLINATNVEYTSFRQSFEMRPNMTRASASYDQQRLTSSLYLTRA